VTGHEFARSVVQRRKGSSIQGDLTSAGSGGP
jgi:hypothetical protein